MITSPTHKDPDRPFLDVISDGTTRFANKPPTGTPSTLQTGRSAMMMADNALWIQLQEQTPELAKDGVYGAFLMQNEQPALLQGGTLVAQSAQSKAPGAAQALVSFLASPQATLPAAAQRGAVVADRSLRDSSYVKGNPFVSFAVDNLDHAQSEGGTPAWMEIRDKVAPILQSAIVGQRSAKAAIDDLTNQCNQAIARIRSWRSPQYPPGVRCTPSARPPNTPNAVAAEYAGAAGPGT